MNRWVSSAVGLRAAQRRNFFCTLLIVGVLGSSLVANVLDVSVRPASASSSPPTGLQLQESQSLGSYQAVIKLGLESLYNSANSYKCYQNPSTPECKMGGIGDIFRFFGSPGPEVQILNELAEIKATLDSIKADTQAIRSKVDIAYFDQTWRDLDPAGILDTYGRFNEVVQTCKGKTVEQIQADLFCRRWLGTNMATGKPITDPSEFADFSRLGQDIGAIAKRPPKNILDAVQGRVPGGGALNALADVITNGAINTHFFTASDSNAILAGTSYFESAELAYLTLYTNYWEAAVGTSVEVNNKQFFIDSMQKNQLNRFSQLYSSTTVDLRTGIMWSTHNTCVATEMQSPNSCRIPNIGRYYIKASCPNPVDTHGVYCALALPVYAYAGSAGLQERAVARQAVLEGLDQARDTSADSSWKVPTKEQFVALIKDRGATSTETYLKDVAKVDFSANTVWTSTMWCPEIIPVQTVSGYWIMACRDRHHADEQYYAPLRVSMNLHTGETDDTPVNACSGDPCKGNYIFVRDTTSTERRSYGIQRLGS